MKFRTSESLPRWLYSACESSSLSMRRSQNAPSIALCVAEIERGERNVWTYSNVAANASFPRLVYTPGDVKGL
jgi:hypothetical protein